MILTRILSHCSCGQDVCVHRVNHMIKCIRWTLFIVCFVYIQYIWLVFYILVTIISAILLEFINSEIGSLLSGAAICIIMNIIFSRMNKIIIRGKMILSGLIFKQDTTTTKKKKNLQQKKNDNNDNLCKFKMRGYFSQKQFLWWLTLRNCACKAAD